MNKIGSGKKYMVLTIISVVGMTFIAIYFYMICRYRPWIGDDALHCFTGGLSYYVHPEYAVSDEHLGSYFSSLPQVLSHAAEYYVSWGGRLLTGVTDPLMVIGGKSVSAAISVCTYIGIILLALRLVYGNIKEVFRHPLIFLSISSLLLFYNEAMDLLIMRCMTNLYGFSFLLYLAIYNLYEHILRNKDSVSIRMIVLINVLGLVAGVSHELIGAWFLFQFIFGTFIRTRNVKKTFINCRYLVGTVISYIMCFVAPGNFARANQPHESGLSTPIIYRMSKSILKHKEILFTYENIGKWIFVGMTFFAVGGFIFLCYKKEFKCWGWIVEKIIYIFVSIVLWGMVASVAPRGIYIALVYLFLIYAKIIYEAEKLLNEKEVILSGVMSLVVLIWVIVDCNYWIPSMVKQSYNRERSIAEAVADHVEDVYVPRYTDECDRLIFGLAWVDSQYELDQCYNIRMYGTHVIIED